MEYSVDKTCGREPLAYSTVHLLTREALQILSGKKLTPDGVLAFNIGNIYLYFTPTLGLQARDAGLIPSVRDDTAVTQAEMDGGNFPPNGS